MAKTFDNISEASETNYLFLFAQRTLALQNEPPTPPPLNAPGLPCEAICLLWAWLHPQKAQDTVLAAETMAAHTVTSAVTVTSKVKAGVVELKMAVSAEEKAAFDKEKQVEAAMAAVAAAAAAAPVKEKAETLSEKAPVQLKAAASANAAADKSHSSKGARPTRVRTQPP